MQPLTHRVRIGCYRLLLTFDKVENKFIVVKVAHRKDIYK
jgi:mRNA-degrading endonuclease RelE of RelBE toxin-antitoxin system